MKLKDFLTKVLRHPLTGRLAITFALAFLVAWQQSNLSLDKKSLLAASIAAGRAVEYILRDYLAGRRS